MMYHKGYKAFSLLELLAALMIASMIIIATVAVYHRGRSAIHAINKKLNENSFTQEVLQRISDDIDEFAADDSDVKMTLESKTEQGMNVYRLSFVSNIYDDDGKVGEYKKVVWQSKTDPQTSRISLYRARGGFALEDSVLDTQRKKFSDGLLFVPVAQELTVFSIIAINADKEFEKWGSDMLPGGIILKISESEAEETDDGKYEVPENLIASRTVSLNKNKMMIFKFVSVSQESQESQEETEDEEQQTEEKAEQDSDVGAEKADDQKKS